VSVTRKRWIALGEIYTLLERPPYLKSSITSSWIEEGTLWTFVGRAGEYFVFSNGQEDEKTILVLDDELNQTFDVIRLR
jgi:hypothetical protein